jgi:acyl-coenzyme A thioesterase PaaI-like protein
MPSSGSAAGFTADDFDVRVRTALANARLGVMHFAHFYVNPVLTSAGGGGSTMELQPAPMLLDAAGEIDLGAVLLALDFTLSAALQAGPGVRRRIATATFQVRFTGEPIQGPLLLAGQVESAVAGIPANMLRVGGAVSSGGRTVLEANALYVRFDDEDARPLLEQLVYAPLEAPIAEESLDADERSIHRRASQLAKDASPGITERLWGWSAIGDETGARGGWPLGPQVLNRYGTAHGGLLSGFALKAAAAAIPGRSRVVECAVSFLGAGTGARLMASSTAVQAGRRAATVDTSIRGAGNKAVLQVLSVHARL